MASITLLMVSGIFAGICGIIILASAIIYSRQLKKERDELAYKMLMRHKYW